MEPKRQNPQTGLGLSQVYGIVRQAGGSARIESRVGAGTTVRLLLRCTSSSAPPADEASSSTPVSRAAAKILLVDDDPGVRQFLEEALAGLGNTVQTAENRSEALEALGRSRPDLLVLDFAMPGMSGAQVCRAAHKLWADLPVILISGYADEEVTAELTDARVVLLGKPFSLDQLAEAIDKVTNKP